MRTALHVCRRLVDGEGSFAFVALVFVGYYMAITDVVSARFGGAMTVRPMAHFFHYWMLVLLLGSHAAWTVMRLWGRVGTAGAPGFLLASFGLMASWQCLLWIYGMTETYGDKSVIEETAGASTRLLIAVARWGGPLAVALGLAIVILGCRRPRYSQGSG